MFLLGLFFGISLFFNFVFSLIIYFLYKKIGSKVTDKDVENFLLNNFLEVDVDV